MKWDAVTATAAGTPLEQGILHKYSIDIFKNGSLVKTVDASTNEYLNFANFIAEEANFGNGDYTV
ncbi:MAG: hypothetical protein HUK08_09240, partial [Bacteroidaceae bacterium]|nr:hypothetical protein [Bacteroidaceae bacterium]